MNIFSNFLKNNCNKDCCKCCKCCYCNYIDSQDHNATQGEQGPTGPQGEQGPRGFEGPEGPQFVGQYAFFSQSNTLKATSLGGGLKFDDPTGISSPRILNDSGIISVLLKGVYKLDYYVYFPANSTANTTLTLQVNNANVSGSVCKVAKQIQLLHISHTGKQYLLLELMVLY